MNEITKIETESAIHTCAVNVTVAVNGGKLADKINRYWVEIDAFNAAPTDQMLPEEVDNLVEQTYEPALREMETASVRTVEDALAAIGWIVREDPGSSYVAPPLRAEMHIYDRTFSTLLDGVRDWLAALMLATWPVEGGAVDVRDAELLQLRTNFMCKLPAANRAREHAEEIWRSAHEEAKTEFAKLGVSPFLHLHHPDPRWREIFDAALERHGHRHEVDIWLPLHDELQEMLDRFDNTPAASMAGIAAKASIVRVLNEKRAPVFDEVQYEHGRVATSLAEDVHRMLGIAA